MAIESVSGTAVNGESLSIAGSGFGTKATAAPVKWEDFSDGVVGSQVDSTGYWVKKSIGDTHQTFVDTVPRYTGAQCIQSVYVGSNVFDWFYKNGLTDGRGFVSYWIRLDLIEDEPPSASTPQIKMFSARAGQEHADYPAFFNNSFIAQPFDSTPDVDKLGDDNVFFITSGSSDVQHIATTHRATEGNWFNFTLQFQDSTLNNADGEAQATQSDSLGVLAYDVIDYVNLRTITTTYPTPINSFNFGYDLEHAEQVTTWFGDIYIDDSWARVEVGDNATYASCIHREVQPPTAWATGEVTVTVNQGSFADGSAYIFVIDEDGTASAGFEITFGDAAPTTATATGMSFSGVSVS